MFHGFLVSPVIWRCELEELGLVAYLWLILVGFTMVINLTWAVGSIRVAM